MTTEKDLQKLEDPFLADSIKVKPITVSKKTGKALAAFYVDARAIQKRLDDVVGKAGWQTKYRAGVGQEANICSLGILVKDQWIWKEDAADNTDVEGTKGGISNSFRRAAVCWGIGRYLYDAPDVWLPFDLQRKRFKNPTQAVENYVKGTLVEYAQQQDNRRQQQQKQTAPQASGAPPRTDAKPKAGPRGQTKKESPAQAKAKARKLLAKRMEEVGLPENWMATVVAASKGAPVKDVKKVNYSDLVEAGMMLNTLRRYIRDDFGLEGVDALQKIDAFYRAAVGEDQYAWMGHDGLESMYAACFPDKQVPA